MTGRRVDFHEFMEEVAKAAGYEADGLEWWYYFENGYTPEEAVARERTRPVPGIRQSGGST